MRFRVNESGTVQMMDDRAGKNAEWVDIICPHMAPIGDERPICTSRCLMMSIQQNSNGTANLVAGCAFHRIEYRGVELT